MWLIQHCSRWLFRHEQASTLYRYDQNAANALKARSPPLYTVCETGGINGIALFCITAIWFFLKGYKKGIAVSGMRILSHIPLLKRWAKRFFESHAEQLATIDAKIAALHGQNPRTFFTAVLLELSCRVVSALEIFFILLVIMPSANYLQCILILAFTSLFANMLFFIPLQLGGREGGFLLSAKGLSIGAREGIFVALLVRLRELIWTAIGLLLIKLEKRQ